MGARLRLLSALAAPAAVLLVLAPLSAARPEAKTINVTAGATFLRVSAKSAPVGSVTFVFRNGSLDKRDFRINGKKTPYVQPSKTAKLIVEFKKAGSFPYNSTVAGAPAKTRRGILVIQAAAAAAGDPVAGKAVFSSSGCAGCHTLQAAGATGTVGPNLDEAMPAVALIVDRVTNGKAPMPSFTGTLSEQQIQDVAAFVYASTHP